MSIQTTLQGNLTGDFELHGYLSHAGVSNFIESQAAGG